MLKILLLTFYDSLINNKFVSDSTAQSVLCQPIVQSNGELIGESFHNM